MRRGVVTVYLSLVFLVMLSLFLVLLESSRVYMIGTMAERYADMAAEMVFSAYVRPMAERYDVLVLDVGEEGKYLEQFGEYLSLNMEGGSHRGRLFDLYAQVQDSKGEGITSIRDNYWQALKTQIEQYEKYSLGDQGIESLQSLLWNLQKSGVDETVKDYSEELQSSGQAMEKTPVESEQENGNIENVEENIEDPRPGISRWMKSGLLKLVMGAKSVSGKSIETENCSWHTEESKKQSLLNSFDAYGEVVSELETPSLSDQIRQGIQDQGTQLLINLYILEKFNRLCGNEENMKDCGASVLEYETEYILFGHASDQENLESTVSRLFMLRTLLNLTYLYTSQEKGAILQSVADGLSLLSVIPVIGQVLKLLLMVCWAAAEAVVDCAALAEGKKVPVMKDDGSWNLTMEQLIAIGKNGGEAAAYVRDGSKGLDYGQYLFILLVLTGSEDKLIRMTQLMECNVRLIEGYEQFSFSRCVTKAKFSGTVHILERFWQHPGKLQHNFSIEYGY